MYAAIDAEMNIVATDNESPHSAAVLRLPFAGIPKVATFGDHTQMLLIGMTSIYDPHPRKPVSADASSQIFIVNLRFPSLDNYVEVARCTTVFTENVLRQQCCVFETFTAHA